MFKKLISVILTLCIAFGMFSVIASARAVEIGGGAESFNPVVFTQEAAIIGSTRVDTNLVATITNKNYKVEINTISAEVLFLEAGDTSTVTVTYESGTVVEDEVKFAVKGDIYTTTNSTVRYTVNYDILDIFGNTVWKNLTGYTYGVVSGSEAVTGAIGIEPGMPGDLDDGARFTSLDKLNSCYVQVGSKSLNYELKTQHFFITFRQRNSEIKVVEGNAPQTLRAYPVDWPTVMWWRQERQGTWLEWSTPESGYYNFTIDMNANDEKWDDQSNTVVSTEMYYLDDQDRANARIMSDRVLGVRGSFSSGFYVQKDKYTEESWNNFLDALDMANYVINAVPGANYGFKLACQNGAKADDNLVAAFYNLIEAPCDWTSHKDPVVGEQSTCGSGGTLIYTCICGKTKIESTGASSCTPSDEWIVTIEPTCTNKGEETQFCIMCSNPVNVRDIEPLGHNYKTEFVLPDCENEGYTIYTCKRCNYTYNDNSVEATGHKPGKAVIENEIEATCTREGSYETVIYCIVCKKELSRVKETSDVLPHTPGEWKVILEPDVRVPGIKALCCAVCDTQMGPTEEIPGLEPYFRATGSTVIDEEKGIIYGIPEYTEDLEGYVEYKGGIVEYIESENGFGTGTIVNYIVDGKVRDIYKVVIFGDLTGDAIINEDDIEIFEQYINFDIEFEEGSAYKYAADIFFHEGVADTYDLSRLYAVVNRDVNLRQDPEKDIMSIDKNLTGNVTVMTVLTEKEVEKDDIITVTVKLSSSDYISNIQIPVIFDKTKFEIVGDSTSSDYLTFTMDSSFATKNYVLNGSADKLSGFEMTSDDSAWNNDEAKNKYGYAYITATYNSAVGVDDSTYAKPQNEDFVMFSLKALADVEDATKSVFVDKTWAKSADNKDGLLVAGLKKTEQYDIYTGVVHYENVTFTTPTTVVEAMQHNPGEIQIEEEVPATCTENGYRIEVAYCTKCGEEFSRNTVIIPAFGHTPGEVVETPIVPAVGPTNAYYYIITYCSVCDGEANREKVVIPGAKIWGTVTSSDDNINNSNDVTIELFYGEELAYTFTVEGSGTVNYEFTNVNPGKYTVKVSKANHVTYTTQITVSEKDNANRKLYEINLLGDVNGDGRVNAIDVALVNAHSKNIKAITGYEKTCADINGDGRINAIDVSLVNAHSKNVKSIWK